ncbi:hypothetical protein FRC01_011259 [Tulasnella sp. 417]|nr:hypothetical protein FRC01_011259 [Tulasnella sp. 417]
MAYLDQLFVKEVDYRLEPFTFFLHPLVRGEAEAEARDLIERHGGIVVTTPDAAEIIVADPCHESFGTLTRQCRKDDDRQKVESIQAIRGWIQREHVEFECENRKKRGGAPPGRRPFTLEDRQREAVYVKWVNETSATPQKDLASDARWKERSAMGAKSQWTQTHSIGSWSRRHRRPSIRNYYEREMARIRRAAEEDNEPEERDPAVIEVIEILDDEDMHLEQPKDSLPLPGPSSGPSRRAGSLVRRTPELQRQQGGRASQDPHSSLRPKPGNRNQRPTGTTKSVAPFIQKFTELRTPGMSAPRVRLETPSQPLIDQLLDRSSGVRPTGHVDPTMVPSASKTLVEPPTGRTDRSMATQTSNRPPFSSSLPGTTISRPNRITNGKPQESPSRRNGLAVNLVEGEDVHMETLGNSSRLLSFGKRTPSLDPDDAATRRNIFKWSQKAPAPRAESRTGTSSSKRR